MNDREIPRTDGLLGQHNHRVMYGDAADWA
jgi:hypothetical protein